MRPTAVRWAFRDDALLAELGGMRDPAPLVPEKAVNDIAQFPLARAVAVRSSAPTTMPTADPEDDGR
jgi:hypothetical protein